MLGINWNYVCKWGGILCTGNTKCKSGGHKNGNNFHRKSHSMDSFINPDALPNKLVARTFCERNDNCIYERWAYSGFAMWKVWVKLTSLYDVNHLWIKVLQLCVQSESPTNCFAWINRFYFPHTLNQKSKNIWIQEKKPFRIAIWKSSIPVIFLYNTSSIYCGAVERAGSPYQHIITGPRPNTGGTMKGRSEDVIDLSPVVFKAIIS